MVYEYQMLNTYFTVFMNRGNNRVAPLPKHVKHRSITFAVTPKCAGATSIIAEGESEHAAALSKHVASQTKRVEVKTIAAEDGLGLAAAGSKSAAAQTECAGVESITAIDESIFG